ncbi:MAG: ribosome maturation factor RimM [Acidocella sp.]|nr:ribosome maturation factor RimM [Acidocella sp.]
MDGRMILMGVIGKPYGVRGYVRVNAFTAEADALADYPLSDEAGRRFSLVWLHDNVARLSEITSAGPRLITDRLEAERLTNTKLFAPRDALPPPDEDEFYLADLVGLRVVDEGGAALGSIAAVHDYGAGTSLEITPGGWLVPFTRAAVPEIDLIAGLVKVVPPPEVTVAGP